MPPDPAKTTVTDSGGPRPRTRCGLPRRAQLSPGREGRTKPAARLMRESATPPTSVQAAATSRGVFATRPDSISRAHSERPLCTIWRIVTWSADSPPSRCAGWGLVWVSGVLGGVRASRPRSPSPATSGIREPPIPGLSCSVTSPDPLSLQRGTRAFRWRAGVSMLWSICRVFERRAAARAGCRGHRDAQSRCLLAVPGLWEREPPFPGAPRYPPRSRASRSAGLLLRAAPDVTPRPAASSRSGRPEAAQPWRQGPRRPRELTRLPIRGPDL